MLLATAFSKANAWVKEQQQETIDKEAKAEEREKMACDFLCIDYAAANNGQSYEASM